MTSSTIALIFARGGSKRVPRKNIRSLAGKPLIAYTIETAKASRHIERVIVSTEDNEIADIARQYGAEVLVRPPELAADNVTAWASWQHAIRELPPIDVTAVLPPTSPLRAPEDVDACIEALLNSEADIAITVTPAENNPYFNMIHRDDAGYARLIIPTDRATRQTVPPVYNITTVAYAARPQFVLSAQSLFDGKVTSVVVPPERALDIDTELDFEFAEYLLSKKRSLF